MCSQNILQFGKREYVDPLSLNFVPDVQRRIKDKIFMKSKIVQNLIKIINVLHTSNELKQKKRYIKNEQINKNKEENQIVP